MNYQQGDIVLVAFPFSSGTQAKQRPALVILDTGDADVVVARVTTQTYQTPNDVTISAWPGAGLLAPSTVRTHKLATMIARLERGGQPPSLRTLERLAEALDADLTIRFAARAS